MFRGLILDRTESFPDLKKQLLWVPPIIGTNSTHAEKGLKIINRLMGCGGVKE